MGTFESNIFKLYLYIVYLLVLFILYKSQANSIFALLILTIFNWKSELRLHTILY